MIFNVKYSFDITCKIIFLITKTIPFSNVPRFKKFVKRHLVKQLRKDGVIYIDQRLIDNFLSSSGAKTIICEYTLSQILNQYKSLIN